MVLDSYQAVGAHDDQGGAQGGRARGDAAGAVPRVEVEPGLLRHHGCDRRRRGMTRAAAEEVRGRIVRNRYELFRDRRPLTPG